MRTTDETDEWTSDLLPPGTQELSKDALTGGVANNVWRVALSDGREVVVKGGRSVPDGFFAQEAESLTALRDIGGLPTPRILHLGAKSLVLESLTSELPETAPFWEAAGRAVAALHEHTSERHGWHRDGVLGLLPQENAWDEDGHRFFAEHRIVRYLSEPLVEATFEAEELRALERLASRLPELVPAAPAVLVHGDLWRANIIADGAESPVFIDPAVYYGWAEIDVSMMYCTGRVPEAFFAAYHEVCPPVGEWQERMDLLNLRELLCMVAHFGADCGAPPRIRDVVSRLA
ncbi:fructosamine kinase family protein [Catenulispora sp. NF23]|uniref:Fructosamine kinase family protein n=1 Tax=Catenulispora pinistramenti TaxID=2705254 RepID=A0ABS5L1P5_9ACTN|nr:fructosamine kinase family protein [Catenulispora pinistramenti]MBS2536610.1 fructosamine kinase family protein [Catenulispora pinistramenti]MBS2552249.1 fructosamine kinase family protein [Catenulispora pinistramenti]